MKSLLLPSLPCLHYTGQGGMYPFVQFMVPNSFSRDERSMRIEGHLLGETEKWRRKPGIRACQLPGAHINREELGLGTSPPWEEDSTVSLCMSPELPCPGESCPDKTERSRLLSEPLPCVSAATGRVNLTCREKGQLCGLEILKHTHTHPEYPRLPPTTQLFFNLKKNKKTDSFTEYIMVTLCSPPLTPIPRVFPLGATLWSQIPEPGLLRPLRKIR